ncbi:polymeric immunoglobulin receptor-like [Clarias gariepinus]|uniref:polymeric immunoglobulin receptor-like n=1 Tax=Clarias gariepinus TaxID=13013 RepID=UPI00234DEBB4|nr:polymeric immunoglobulin receptor-like [Clarias gariepinus]
MIKELTVQDNGTYHCGAGQIGKDIYTPVELRVKEGASGSREVTAYAGTRSNIKCTYEDEYKDKIKFFCKIGTAHQCSDQIRTETKNLWTHDGRFSIHDNKSAGFFSVFIRELITEDTGTYACAVAVSGEIESYTIVKFNVTEALSIEKSISETVPVGGDLNVRCKYPESHRSDNKFLCKKTATAACSYNITVKENRKIVNKGKFSLHDERAGQIMSVSIKNIAERDSGEYWCGAEANWTSDDGYKVYFTRINLTVTGFPLSTVIAVSVTLLVLLIISLILIATVCKRCKKQGPEITTQTSGETNGEYENYPNAFNFQSRQMNNLSESVYQSLDTNTNQSDSTYQRLDN